MNINGYVLFPTERLPEFFKAFHNGIYRKYASQTPYIDFEALTKDLATLYYTFPYSLTERISFRIKREFECQLSYDSYKHERSGYSNRYTELTTLAQADSFIKEIYAVCKETFPLSYQSYQLKDDDFKRIIEQFGSIGSKYGTAYTVALTISFFEECENIDKYICANQKAEKKLA